MILRPYDPARDRDAAYRVWCEVGWAEDSEEHRRLHEAVARYDHALVGDVHGQAECLVNSMPATLRYLAEDLPMLAIPSVCTSHVGRKQGLASHLTALTVANGAAEGALVAGLGMFDQGFYDQLGFGTGTYDHWATFDPALLTVDVRPRPPRRLIRDDWEATHACRLQRLRGHGAVSLLAPEATRSRMLFAKNVIGLGYYDGPDGTLSHHLWCIASNMERGPFQVRWLAYRTREQFLELMALLKSLGDQMRMVGMIEPPGVQIQDLLRTPFKQREMTRGTRYATGIDARAWWQMRMLDVPGCLARTHLPGGTVRCNLHLSDPIASYLAEDAPWHGLAGDYVITLGTDSAAEPGIDPTLPTLTASVNAFTRLWLGVRPATGLAFTDDLAGPPELLQALDDALRLPEPMPDWEF